MNGSGKANPMGEPVATSNTPSTLPLGIFGWVVVVLPGTVGLGVGVGVGAGRVPEITRTEAVSDTGA